LMGFERQEDGSQSEEAILYTLVSESMSVREKKLCGTCHAQQRYSRLKDPL
jgi:hypothetical protein